MSGQKTLMNGINPQHVITWDQALFSFRFVNNIPAGMAKRKENSISAVAIRENVWDSLKLGLISG